MSRKMIVLTILSTLFSWNALASGMKGISLECFPQGGGGEIILLEHRFDNRTVSVSISSPTLEESVSICRNAKVNGTNSTFSFNCRGQKILIIEEDDQILDVSALMNLADKFGLSSSKYFCSL